MNDVNQELRDYAKRHKAWHRKALGLPEEIKAQTTQNPLPVSQTSRFNPKLVMFTVACLFSAGLLWWGLETFEKYSQSQGMGGAPPLKLEAPSLQSRTQKTITAPTNKDDLTTFHAPWGLPGGDGQIVVRDSYILNYMPTKKAPSYVCYRLQSGNKKKADGWYKDPDFDDGQQKMKPTGYGAVTLVPPSHLSGLSKKKAKEGRFFTVTLPVIESVRRKIAPSATPALNESKETTVWVIAGPILSSKGPFVEGIHIPTKVFYIYAKIENEKIFTWSRLIDNRPNSEFVNTSIDEIEKMTTLDFFPNLSKEDQAALESQVNKW